MLTKDSDNATNDQHPLIKKLPTFFSHTQNQHTYHNQSQQKQYCIYPTRTTLQLVHQPNQTTLQLPHQRHHHLYVFLDCTYSEWFLGKFKHTMMSHLQQEKTWLKAHPMAMATVETTSIGRFCKDRHPDATNL